MKYNEIPLSVKTKEREFVTFCLDSKTNQKFNDLSAFYGHGGKRRLLEFLINHAENILDFPKGKHMENEGETQIKIII
jgi:hypothetical protein